MEALDNIRNYNINSNVEFHLEDTLDTYKNYLSIIDDLTLTQKNAFLRIIKTNELINNQEMEHEDPFMVQLDIASSNGKKRASIDVMSESIMKDQPLTIKKMEQLHRLLIRGTSDDIERNYKIRDFDTHVSEVINGVEKVSYVPPEPEKIKPYLKDIIKFLHESDKNENDILLNSILIHFYIAALQPFGNGNTRLARLIEYGSIFKLSRDVLGTKIKEPALFLSDRYLVTRKQYRDSIATLITEPTDENFNKWVDYNLNMMDEQLYYNTSALKKMIKR